MTPRSEKSPPATRPSLARRRVVLAVTHKPDHPGLDTPLMVWVRNRRFTGI